LIATPKFGKSDYRNIKGRRVSGLSIGYPIRNSTNTAAGNELTELELIDVPIVARGPMIGHSSSDATPV